LANGPFYFIPVAPAGFKPGSNIVSMGLDSMKWPPTYVHASILTSSGGITYTRERPIPGRSGGGLIDVDGRVLIAVCQGYEVRPNGRGMYVSHATILAFLEKHKAFFTLAPRAEAPSVPPVITEQKGTPPSIAPASPYILIAREDRLPNRTGSQCVWVSLGTLARHHKLSAAYGIEKNPSTSGPGEVASVLRVLGVQFKQQMPGNRSLAIVEEACAQKLGCMVGLSGRHAVVVVGIDAQSVYVLDNGGPKACEVEAWSRTKFVASFDGWCICLLTSGHQVTPAPSVPTGPRDAPIRTNPRTNPAPRGQQGCPT
jgi:hypothetical protein